MKRNRVKAFLTAALALCLAVPCTVSSFAVSAAAPQLTIQPRYIGTEMVTATIDISSTGKATCWGAFSAELNYTGDVTMFLQRQDGDDWTDIKSWEASGDIVSFDKSWYVTKGHTYRVQVVAEVRNAAGTLVEVTVATSGHVSY